MTVYVVTCQRGGLGSPSLPSPDSPLHSLQPSQTLLDWNAGTKACERNIAYRNNAFVITTANPRTSRRKHALRPRTNDYLAGMWSRRFRTVSSACGPAFQYTSIIQGRDTTHKSNANDLTTPSVRHVMAVKTEVPHTECWLEASSFKSTVSKCCAISYELDQPFRTIIGNFNLIRMASCHHHPSGS